MRSSWTFHKQTRLPLRKPILKVGNSQYETPLNLAASYNSWVNREMIGLCERYLVQLGEAIADGVEVLGHTAWGCIDLVSFTTAELSKRCGFIYVDRKDDGTGTVERYKKKSLDWYTQVIATNGASLRRGLL